MEINEIINSFCNNIRVLRKREGLSKKKMAKIMGIGIKSLSLIEDNILPRRLRCGVLIKIHNYFGILPSEIVSADFQISKKASPRV
ncbi:MAG: helix-turn-helix transcriptional regulator [Clostridia bacterium]|nr:helix-turn-helix transcriptional regulator [Clostridia bacterium]MBQ7789211.1 helix-turn-helix transcriptional regulator [Clostridia bacterium]